MHIIRRSSFKAVPWKNGGGITHEVIRAPMLPVSQDPQPFRWRVSVAEIDAAGPFSEFPDQQRIMVLLRGAGVHLTFANHGSAALRAVGDVVEFDGAWSTHCDLADGPCTDLNLMVNKALPPARARVLRVSETHALGGSAEPAMTLLFAVSGAVEVRADGAGALLEPWDFAVAPAGEQVTLSSAFSAPSLVFCATLQDSYGR